jgi:quercetin 2,3-dioxygenase
VLFWVNLARKDKKVDPSARVVDAEDIQAYQKSDAAIRVLVGEGSSVQLGTTALILDVELPEGGRVTTDVPAEFQGFAYLLEGEASFGANRRGAPSASAGPVGKGINANRDGFRSGNPIHADGGQAVR